MAANLNNAKLLWVLIVCFFVLSGCGVITSQNYEPLVGEKDPDDNSRAIIILSDKVMLRAYVRCDYKGIAIPQDPDRNPKYCSTSIWIFGTSLVEFGFSNYDLVLRDGENRKNIYERLNYQIFEGDEDHFYVLKNVDSKYNYLRGFNTGFLLDKRPRILEVIVPDVVIEGVVYKVPVLKFEYSEHTTFQHILMGG